MLDLIIPATEKFDETKLVFINYKEQKLCLEHSLISLSKWESKWKKPFLSDKKKTPVETLDYIRCMTLTQNVNPDVYLNLSEDNISEVLDYIKDPMTATTIHYYKPQKKKTREVITSELIYYWMLTYNIPFECQKWHLNRLLKLIEVCSAKSDTSKKMSRAEILEQNRSLNEQRRKQFNTKG